MMFEKIVKAALAEANGKRRLAQALAVEIPRGADVRAALVDARQAIIDGGGEPRTVSALDDYRQVGLWVADRGGVFRWRDDVSFSAHREAQNGGMRYSDFARMAHPTVDSIRAKLGRAGTDGPAHKVAEKWRPEQRVEVAKSLLADPDVAAKVAADDDVRVSFSDATRKHDQRVRDEVEAGRDAGTRRVHDATERSGALVDLSEAVLRLRSCAQTLTEVGVPDQAFADEARFDLDKIKHFVGWIETALDAGSASMDDELRTLLSE